MQIREKYVKMITENPDDVNLKVNIENFDEALTHPDNVDLENVKKWAQNMLKK